MATADEIRAQIIAQQQELEQAKARVQRASADRDEALVRKQLRADLKALQEQTREQNSRAACLQMDRVIIDQVDDVVSCLPRSHNTISNDTPGPPSKVQSAMDCKAAVASGELEWRIKGFSWLEDTLEQERTDSFAMSCAICVGGHTFQLLYHPGKGTMGEHAQRGSLAIRHKEPEQYEGVTFRYTIWIQSKERGFVQWGESGSVCELGDTHDMIFGPDVCDRPAVPEGIFNMSHAQLMNSEWVIDDLLTAKLKVEVRPDVGVDHHDVADDEIVVPPSTLADKFVPLLDSGDISDVTFIIRGESIRAHSLLLSASSDVLRRLLACGMQESISKEITIEDCEPKTFSVFLRYLYTDSFASLENFIAGHVAEQSSSSSSNSHLGAHEVGAKMSILQQLLAVSHKYQVDRLQLWCERELSRHITIEHVCSVLCQAHLYEAKQLEKKCLDFIKLNKNEVVKTDAFGSLSLDWPHVCLKISLHFGAVDERSAAEAMDKQRCGQKRKREGSGD